jgi:hypothetical protein
VPAQKTFDVPAGQRHKFCVDYRMTISFILSELEQVDSQYPVYILESSDGSYYQKLSAGSDLVAAGDYMQLQFKKLARDKTYKLTRYIEEDWSEVVFDGIAFDVIVDQERSIHDILPDHKYGELNVDVGSTVDAISWDPGSGASGGDGGAGDDLSDVVV